MEMMKLLLGGSPCTHWSIAQSVKAPPNDPLTLDQLREMDGEPVWAEHCNGGEWITVHWDRFGKITTSYKGSLWDHEYGDTWLAYRRKPEEVSRK